MKHFKSTIILMTGILFFVIATIPVTLFSQPMPQKEGRAVWISSTMFENDEKEATNQLKELLDKYAEIGINNLFCFSSMMNQNQ